MILNLKLIVESCLPKVQPRKHAYGLTDSLWDAAAAVSKPELGSFGARLRRQSTAAVWRRAACRFVVTGHDVEAAQ